MAMTDRTTRDAEIEASTTKICREVRQHVQKALLETVGREACIYAVSRRLNIKPSDAKGLLCGTFELTLDQVSDLCASAGLEPVITLEKIL
jgi:hypothetical protein